MSARVVEVLRAGALTTVQDLGRAGHAHLGVPRSGALDAPAHRSANALVGNRAEAATLEVTAVGCVLRTHAPAVVAVAGADCAIWVGGVPAPWGAPVRLGAGQVVELGPARGGVRSYLAVRGGIDVPHVLGSRATDVLSGLGPAPLRDGDVLPIGDEARHEAAFGSRTRPAEPTEELVLEARWGPRAGWLADDGRTALETSGWTASADSNRVGLRLDGAPLARHAGELASEGMVLGAVQVPPSGLPVVFLADHPTTGGYPVVAVVDDAGVAAAAQAAPGTRVRFRLR